MNDHVEPGGYVEAASGLLLVYAMGAVAGPLISSTFMQHFGPDAMFGVTASVHLALAGFAFYRMRQRARDRTSTRLTPGHNAKIVCRILIENKKKKPINKD